VSPAAPKKERAAHRPDAGGDHPPRTRRAAEAGRSADGARLGPRDHRPSASAPAPERAAAARRIWLYPLSVLTGISMAVFFVVHEVDVLHGSGTGGFWDVFFTLSVSDAAQAMGGIGEVIAAILGIVITVASIIVQLAATRYSARVTEMFFRDRTNLAVMAFFVVSAVFSLWVNFSIRAAADGTEPSFVPRYGVLVTMILLTLSLLLMAPYFAYVFDFLEPDKIVGRIKAGGIDQALRAQGGEVEARVGERQMLALSSLEQLADVALNAIEAKDKGIATDTVDAVCDLVISYLPRKGELDERWFQIQGRLRRDPDFVSMNTEALDKLTATRTWLEYKALRQFLMIYREALTLLPDIINLIAIDTRYMGQAAVRAGDRAALGVVVKFFNTYMRRALNARDIAAGYNNLNQYRYLGEELLQAGWDDEVVRIAEHFKYYAQTAQANKLPFLTETVAFDLCTLNELCHDLGSRCREALLRIFLEVDKEADLEQQDSCLRGVRKAQVKLATHYLQKGDEELARKIWRDMKDERPDRLRSIQSELLAVTTSEFWEVNDRGGVFEYIEPERRQFIHAFFAWFPSLSVRPPPPALEAD
jgi:hypothetical protein